MQVVLYFLALMTTLVAALPTTYTNDGRGATIFTSQNFGGASTAIPGNAWCTDLSNLFGSFEGKVRSLSVQSGYECQFYNKSGCNGDKLDIRGAQSQSQLGYGFDNNLYSARCTQV